MRIEDCAGKAKQGLGKQTEKPLQACFGLVGVTHECFVREIVLSVFEMFFARAEAEFESPQTVVGQRSAAQMQRSEVAPGIMLNRFPHQEVAGTKILKSEIGCAKFVDCLIAVFEEHRRSDGLLLK